MPAVVIVPVLVPRLDVPTDPVQLPEPLLAAQDVAPLLVQASSAEPPAWNDEGVATKLVTVAWAGGLDTLMVTELGPLLVPPVPLQFNV